MTGSANRDLLEAAIIGYQTKIAELQQRITEIRMRLDGLSNSAVIAAPSAMRATGCQHRFYRTWPLAAIGTYARNGLQTMGMPRWSSIHVRVCHGVNALRVRSIEVNSFGVNSYRNLPFQVAF